jgi:ACT domain-containing protein
MMKAIVTVIGKDRVGITAAVCSLLAQYNINILDITQTVLQDFFTMVMLVDTAACTASIGEMSELLNKAGQEQELSIRIQREDIFKTMHRI